MDSKNIIISLAASALVMVSCHDYRNDYLVDLGEKVYLSTESSPIRNVSPFEEDCSFGIIKSGKGLESALVEVAVSPTALVKYNRENGTRYVNLPESMYTFKDAGTPIKIGKDEARVEVPISWDADILSCYLLLEKEDYVIPLQIVNSNLDVAEGREMLLLHPVVPKVGLRTRLSREIVYSDTLSGKAVMMERVLLSNPIPNRELTVNLVETTTEGYTSTVGSLPDGAFELLSETVTIDKGKTYAEFAFRVDYDKFLDGAAMVTKDPCVAAVKISGTSIDYLPIGQEIMYFPFKYKAPVK